MIFSSESDKLHSALLCVKEHQSEKAKIDEQESASALVSTSAKDKKDESYNIDNSHLLFSARDFLDEDDYPTTSFTNLCPLF